MADIARRDPFEFGNLRQAMERLFDDSFFRMPRAGVGSEGWDEGTLPVDISEKEHALVVRASLPGYKKEDIDVQLNQGVLSVTARKSEEHEDRDERYYRRERSWGAVSRRIALPGIVHDADVQAQLKDGVLTLTIPVPEKARPKQIQIMGDDASQPAQMLEQDNTGGSATASTANGQSSQAQPAGTSA